MRHSDSISWTKLRCVLSVMHGRPIELGIGRRSKGGLPICGANEWMNIRKDDNQKEKIICVGCFKKSSRFLRGVGPYEFFENIVIDSFIFIFICSLTQVFLSLPLRDKVIMQCLRCRMVRVSVGCCGTALIDKCMRWADVIT